MGHDGNNGNNNNHQILIPTYKMGGFSAKRSIAERRGFCSDAARINTARFRTTSPLDSPAARSPCLTIPPGISPTALLDSPIMLLNSQAMPSPTTGTFLLPPLSHEGLILTSVTLDEGDGGSDAASSFKFQPQPNPNSLPPSSVSENLVSNHCIMAKGGIADCQPFVPVQPDFAIPAEFPKAHTTKTEVHSYNDVKMINGAICTANNVEMQMRHSEEATDESSLPKKANKDIGERNLLGDKRETNHSMGMARNSEDGYNWRKYGQKQVKGSEYPRSYYKCTHPNCQVKKKVERSLDGQITEIIYKSSHNHEKPQSSRRPSVGSALSTNEMGEGGGTCVKVEGSSIWRNIQSGMKDIKHNLDWKVDIQERTSSTSVVTELSDPLSTNKGKPVCMFESEDTLELSSTLASQDDDEDGATQGCISLEGDADDEESEAKRRKKESCMIESNFASRAVREPRVVVQIESEVDILDDGYRWRKYGQKVVKGNPNPRSYYKCTSAGCLVRKHVERASHDLKYVITTYEGKHNHEVPTARSNSQMSSSGACVLPNAANAQVTLPLPGNVNIPKPETQVQNLAPHFDIKPEFNSEFLRPGFVGSFSDDMKYGASSICQMKYSPLPYSSYELNPDRCAPVFPDFPSLPMNLTSSGKFPLVGYNFNSVKPMGPIQSFLSGGQQLKEVGTGFVRLKQEQKDNILYDTSMPIVDYASSSSVYHRLMQNFPS